MPTGRLSCTAPKGVVTPELRTELRDRKEAILEFLKASNSALPLPPIETISRTGQFEPSSRQSQMWFLQQLDSESTAYHVGGALRFREGSTGRASEEPKQVDPSPRSPADKYRRS